tara:strand:+ start:16672 stop:18741 length:2070 start_codon:yes stop_codon:yes gene_type:complete
MSQTNQKDIFNTGISKEEFKSSNTKVWWNKVFIWWSGFSLRTKLLAIATLAVSLIMTGITFFALSSIEHNAGMNDTRYARDLGLLLSGNVTELVANNQKKEISNVAEKFWRSSRNLRYIFFTNSEDIVQLGIPISVPPTSNNKDFQLTRKLKLPPELKKRPQFPLVRQHSTPQGQVTDVYVPMMWKGEYLGTLALGVTPNKKALASAALTREVSVAVFISIWVLLLLGAVFNALTITRPVKELLRGVKEIAKGNFKSRISIPMNGEMGELLSGFNGMASQLENYDAANIEELKAEQVKQESLIATMADGAILLNSEGNIVLVNPTARRLFRWEGRNLEGKDLLNEIPEVLANDLHTTITSILNKELESDDIRCSIGEPPRILRIVLQSVLDSSKITLKGIAVTIQDLTREVELNAAQNRFISNVSHELRTPLSNIKSYIETLHDLKNELTDEEQIDFLSVANSETDRLTRLVNDVLDLSRLEAGKIIQLESIDIKPALEQCLRNYKLNAIEKKVNLGSKIEENIPSILGNWDLLLQVFDNLIGNALKFNKPHGNLIIKAYTWPDICVARPPEKSDDAPFCELVSPLPKVRIEIADTGFGISEQDQEKIFERFFRVENSVHTERGTGLGLSIVRGIIEKHGGEIRMASEPEIGTTFWFDLPLAESDKDEVLLKSINKAMDLDNELLAQSN